MGLAILNLLCEYGRIEQMCKRGRQDPRDTHGMRLDGRYQNETPTLSFERA